MGAAGQEGPIAARGWAGHQSGGGKQLSCASLVSPGFYLSLLFLSIIVTVVVIVIVGGIIIIIITIFYYYGFYYVLL